MTACDGSQLRVKSEGETTKAPSEKTSEVELPPSEEEVGPQPRELRRAAPLPVCISQHATWTSEVNRSLCGSAVTTPTVCDTASWLCMYWCLSSMLS